MSHAAPNAPAPPPGPSPPDARDGAASPLSPAFRAVAAAGVACAAGGESLMLWDDGTAGFGLLLAILAVPMLGRTLVVLRGRARRGVQTPGERTAWAWIVRGGIVLLFLASVGLTAFLGMVAAFSLVCATPGPSARGMDAENWAWVGSAVALTAVIGWIWFGWWWALRRGRRNRLKSGHDTPGSEP